MAQEVHELRQRMTASEAETRKSFAGLRQSVHDKFQAHDKVDREVQELKTSVQELTFHKVGLPISFRVRQDGEERVYLPPFYTHSHGYKFCVDVLPQGYGDGKGTHVSIYTHLMKGQFDDHLKWPFRGEITIQIVNQDGNHDHVEGTILYNDEIPDANAGRVTGKNRAGGWVFFAHSLLMLTLAITMQRKPSIRRMVSSLFVLSKSHFCKHNLISSVVCNKYACVMKALKCKTLGGIHIHHVLSHIEPRTFHTHYRQAVYTAHARTSASLPRVGPRLYLACFSLVSRRLHQ